MKRAALAGLALGAALALAVGACGTRGPVAESLPDEAVPAPDFSEMVRGAMYTDVEPCTDFYVYACGEWIRQTTLPRDQPRWVRSFSVIHERNQELMRRILEREGRLDAGRRKLSDFYASCMDETARDEAHLNPIRPLLAEIETVDDVTQAVAMAARIQEMSRRWPLFRFWVDRDARDGDLDLLVLAQGGLGLPDRAYYLQDEARPIRGSYLRHAVRMLELAGLPPEGARSEAEAILAFETELARISKPRESLRDVSARYNPMDRAGLRALDPYFPWEAWFGALGREELSDLNVADPEYFRELGGVLRTTPRETLRAYLRWHLLSGSADELSGAFEKERFAFVSRLTGQYSMAPRWKRCTAATHRAFPDLLGKAFVAASFSGESQDRARTMMDDIREAFVSRLPALGWMDDETRAAAADKARRMRARIGHPETWRRYDDVDVRRDAFFDNAVAAARSELRAELDRVGRRQSNPGWRIPAASTNGYYDPSVNEIVFPAGVLQPPFFHRSFPDAANYGSIGMLMGHELTHGFDDQGRRFDADGRLEPWWTPEAERRFEERSACLVEDASAVAIRPGLNLDGRLTLGENIADLGGLALAHRAWRARATARPEPSPIEGLSAEQLFFVSFAQAWCSIVTPEYEAMLARIDPHAPPHYRVNGSLRSSPAFWEAFGCEEGTPMRAENLCEVW